MSNKPIKEDWHPADIKAALEKKGYSFARIARENGYKEPGPNNVLRSPWAHIEKIVARIIGVKAAEIWPSRYDRRGRPLKTRPGKVEFRLRAKITEHKAVCNG